MAIHSVLQKRQLRAHSRCKSLRIIHYVCYVHVNIASDISIPVLRANQVLSNVFVFPTVTALRTAFSKYNSSGIHSIVVEGIPAVVMFALTSYTVLFNLLMYRVSSGPFVTCYSYTLRRTINDCMFIRVT